MTQMVVATPSTPAEIFSLGRLRGPEDNRMSPVTEIVKRKMGVSEDSPHGVAAAEVSRLISPPQLEALNSS